MTIPDVRFDNPIDLEKIPKQELSLRLPAISRPDDSRTWYNGLRFTALIVFFHSVLVVLCCDSDFYDYRLVTWAKESGYGVLYLYAAALMIRPFVQLAEFTWLPIVLGLVASVGVMARQSPPELDNYGAALAVLGLVHWALELAYYRYKLTTANSVLDQKSEPLQVAISMMILGIGGITGVFMIGLLIGGMLPSIAVTTSCIWAAAHMIEPRVHFTWTSLHSAFQTFLFYPSSKGLPPGLIPSPVGSYVSRFFLLGTVVAILLGPAILHLCHGLDPRGIAWLVAAPLCMVGLAKLLLCYPLGPELVGDAGVVWRNMIQGLRRSTNQLESESIHLGYVAADHSPVLIDRSLCLEHMHILGATGSNKSSLGLAPLIEQFISFPDTSVVIIDLKGDTAELYHAAKGAIDHFRPNTALQFFSLENGSKTHIFNPFYSDAWEKLSLLERSDVLCKCCGLVYGFEYGRAFYTMGNSSVMTNINVANPSSRSFRQLALEANRLLKEQDSGANSELRRIGLHAIESIRRLACYDSINYVPQDPQNDEVQQNRIDLAGVFQRPTVVYFKLPSTTTSIGASALARFVIQNLIIAARFTNRKMKVHLVIDEFQRALGEGVEHTLQLARSHDIGLVLSNQSMADLDVTSPKVYQAVAGNCAIRRWFSAMSKRDLEELYTLMGTTEVTRETVSRGPDGTTTSYQQEHEPRARMTDLHAISEESSMSFLQVAGRGRGYARYNGIPFVCYSEYHISEEQYLNRKSLPWPSDLPGMIVAKESYDSLQPSSSVATKKKSNTRLNQDPDLFGSDFD